MSTKKQSRNLFKLKTALAQIDGEGIEVGDYVDVYWDVDKAYGGGRLSHRGKLFVLERETGWFEVKPSNASPGHLKSSILAMGTHMTKISDPEQIEKLEAELAARAAPAPRKPAAKTGPKKNPFVDKASVKKNPFLVKAGR